MFEEYNQNSQPQTPMAVFNNWKVVVESWYCVGPLESLSEKKILNAQIGQQKLVLFQTEKGSVHCLDAFCAHMGLNLATGTVEGERLRCQFHHWSYDGQGEASTPNCQKLKDNRNLNSYPVEIRYGLIWVWAGKTPAYSLPFHPDLPPGSFVSRLGKSYSRPSHPHISLLNALDVQHVNTVHALELNVTCVGSESSDGSMVHYDFAGKFLTTSKKGKRSAFFTGGNYKYSVRYVGGTVGYLKALDGIRLFGQFPMRPMYATFGYRPEGEAKTVIQPVFLTPKISGVVGWLKAQFHLWLSGVIYNRLKNEDGEIYENIRFTPHFQAEDTNILKFIAHVNRLPKSNF